MKFKRTLSTVMAAAMMVCSAVMPQSAAAAEPAVPEDLDTVHFKVPLPDCLKKIDDRPGRNSLRFGR